MNKEQILEFYIKISGNQIGDDLNITLYPRESVVFAPRDNLEGYVTIDYRTSNHYIKRLHSGLIVPQRLGEETE